MTTSSAPDIPDAPAGDTNRPGRLVSAQLAQRAIGWRRHLHAHPELSFQEVETAAFVERTLRAFDGLAIERPTPTSVVARLRGSRPGRTLALRADMDALPIHEETGLPFASTRDGVMHACGHDAHTAILLAAASLLAERRGELAGELRLLFQHAEEVPPGGARELVAAGVLDGVDAIVGLHLLADEPLGVVSVPPGPRLAAMDTFRVRVTGSGGHGARPHKTIDPIPIAAEAIVGVQQIVARTVDPLESAVVSVTRVHAGTADNVIPETVELGGTIRTFEPELRSTVPAALERVVGGIAAAHGARCRFELLPGYPSLHNDPATAALVERAVRTELGDAAIGPIAPMMGAEDFAVYLQKVPGAYVLVGAGDTDRPPHHHPRFEIDEDAIAPAIALFARAALDYLGA